MTELQIFHGQWLECETKIHEANALKSKREIMLQKTSIRYDIFQWDIFGNDLALSDDSSIFALWKYPSTPIFKISDYIILFIYFIKCVYFVY